METMLPPRSGATGAARPADGSSASSVGSGRGVGTGSPRRALAGAPAITSKFFATPQPHCGSRGIVLSWCWKAVGSDA